MNGIDSAVLLVTIRQSSFINEEEALCYRDNVLAEHRLTLRRAGILINVAISTV